MPTVGVLMGMTVAALGETFLDTVCSLVQEV